jgi:phytoene synthase
MSEANVSTGAAGFCADLVRTHDFVRYASTLFVPTDQRRALLALYAFNVEISRIRHHVTQAVSGEVRLQWWTDMLAGKAHGGVEGSPVAAELLLAIGHAHLPIERLSRLIDEHQFDLYNDPMPTMAALEGYLHDTSSALFSLAARIAGWQSDEIEHLARHAGFAQGIVQVVATLRIDASRRQFAGKQTPQLRAALDQLISEAREHLGTAMTLLESAPPPVRPLFLPLAIVRQELQRMSRADSNLFEPRPASRLQTLWTLWRASRSPVFRA